MILFIFFYLLSFQEKNPALLYLKSQVAIEQNNYEEAEKFLKEAIKLNPSDVFLKIELARVLIYSGKVAEAGDVLKGISPSDNLKGDYYSLKFYVELTSGEVDKAVESYSNIKDIELSKENVFFITQAIQANILKYLSEEDPANSIKLLKIYLNLFPEDITLKEALLNLFLEAKDLKEAEELIKKLTLSEESYPLILKYLSYLYKENSCRKILEMEKNFQNEEREEMLQIYSYCYFVEGQPEKVLETLSRILTLNPKNELALRMAIEIKIIDGQYEAARALLDVYPREREEQVNYIRETEALMYQLKGETEKAEEIYLKLLGKYESKERVKILKKIYNFYKGIGNCTKVLDYAFKIYEEEDNQPLNYLRIAEAYLINRDPDKGYFYLKIYNDYDEPQNLYESIWLLLDYGYLKEAEELIEKFKIYEKNSPLLHQAMGLYYFKNGMVSEMEEVLKKDKEDAHSLNLLGYFLIEKNQKLDEAISYIQKAIELQPYNGAFLDSLGWGYYKKGDYEKAYKYLRQANYLQPYSGTILSHLGEVSLKMGNYEEALLRFRQALYFQEQDMPDALKKIEEILRNFRKKIKFK
ncbi:MAG: tetratricopeptide repeat protein [Thermoanaerobaculia bacterium]